MDARDCHAGTAEAGLAMAGRSRRKALARLVRNELQARTQGGYLTLREMSLKLCVSTRTLKRHLRDAGASYRELLDGVRRERASELLTRPGLTVEAIADRLGYSSGANFSRAFQRWMGMAPGQFRESLAPARPAMAPGPGLTVEGREPYFC